MRTQGSMVKRRDARSFRTRVEALEGRELLTLDVTPYPLEMIARSTPTSLVNGPDQNLWVTESELGKLAKVSTSGELIQEYTLPGFEGRTLGSVVAAKDALWFSEYVFDPQTGASAGKIVRFTTADQKITEFNVEAGATVASLAVGSDDNIWFTENVYNNGTDAPRVGRLTPDGKLTTFAVPGASGYFGEIAAGAAGTLWFLDSTSTEAGPSVKIGRITTDGVATEFPVSAVGIYANGLTVGPDGNIWFSITSYTGQSNQVSIASMTPSGDLKTYPLTADVATYGTVSAITPGSDGNVWFTTNTSVGKITPAGKVTTAALPSTTSTPLDLTLGSDGNVWYTRTDGTHSTLGKVTPALGITEYQLPTSTTKDPALGISVYPANLVLDDGTHWFTTNNGTTSRINKIANDGKITSFDLTPTSGGLDYVSSMVKGPDGNIWFASTNNAGGTIGKITADGTITRFAAPKGCSPTSLVSASDGNLWSVAQGDRGQKLVRITPTGIMKAFSVPKGLTLAGPILSGPDGRVWVGASRLRGGRRRISAGEVAAFNPTTRRFTEYVMPKNPNGGSGGPIPLPIHPGGPIALARSATAKSEPGIVASPTSPIPAGDSKDAKMIPPIYNSPYYQPVSMIVGRDGNIWMTASAGSSSRIVKLTTRGKMTSFDVPGGAQGTAITLGADGNYWFSMNRMLYYPIDIRPGYFNQGPATIGRITPTGVISTFTLPDGFSQVSGLTSGSDNMIWLTDSNNSRLAKFAPPPLFSGVLDPKEVKGTLPDTTNDATPTFNGSAHPNARITLFGVGAGNINVPLGTAMSDATGAWKIKADHQIPDGSYDIMGGETNDVGAFVGNPLKINNGNKVTIDTAGPRILPGYDYDRTTRTVTFTIADAGVGFDVTGAAGGWVPYLSDTGTYSLIPEGATKSLNFSVKLASGATSRSATVVLTLTDPITPPGRLKLTVKSASVLDQAGNMLDGENRAASLPSGNGKPGGDFVAWINQDAN